MTTVDTNARVIEGVFEQSVRTLFERRYEQCSNGSQKQGSHVGRWVAAAVVAGAAAAAVVAGAAAAAVVAGAAAAAAAAAATVGAAAVGAAVGDRSKVSSNGLYEHCSNVGTNTVRTDRKNSDLIAGTSATRTEVASTARTEAAVVASATAAEIASATGTAIANVEAP